MKTLPPIFALSTIESIAFGLQIRSVTFEISCDLRAKQANRALGVEAIVQEDTAVDLRTVRAERIARSRQLRAGAMQEALDPCAKQENLSLGVNALEKERAVNNNKLGTNAPG